MDEDADDDELRERRGLTLEDLLDLGNARLTAISAYGVIGIDDVFYRWHNSLDRERGPRPDFSEIFDDELMELETGVVVNRLDCFVSLQARTMPPLAWPGLVYAIDELTSKVLFEVGYEIGIGHQYSRTRVRLAGDREETWMTTEGPQLRFHYLRGGYIPRWLKGKREAGKLLG